MAELTVEPMVGNDFWSLLDNIAHSLGIHCGIPQGIGEFHITTEFKPLKDLLETLNPKTSDEATLDVFIDGAGIAWKIRKDWFPTKQWKGMFGRAVIMEDQATKKCRLLFLPHEPSHRRFEMLMDTLGCRTRYSFMKPELKAQKRLFKELSRRQKEQYVTTDTFAEVGKSGTIYMLRKSRPTIAIRRGKDGGGIALCALCLHPVAYYTATWAGVLPPSDEVLTHIAMIRHSEHFFWRKTNQIPIEHETSGV